MFFKKYKYIENDKKAVRYVNGDLEISSDDSDE